MTFAKLRKDNSRTVILRWQPCALAVRDRLGVPSIVAEW